MTKLLGALLLTLGCFILGAGRGASLAGRARRLWELSKALELMEGEICERLTPLPELTDMLSRELTGPVGGFFAELSRRMPELGSKSFASLWREAAAAAPGLCLKPEERDELCRLGLSLGRFGAGEQRTALKAAARRFSGFAEAADAEAKTGKRLYSGLGLALGLMLAAVLV